MTALSILAGEARWLPAADERLTDDEPPELAFYCPDSAKREFGG